MSKYTDKYCKSGKHQDISDWSGNPLGTGYVVHLYCRACGWHRYKGQEYTRQEWEVYINGTSKRQAL